MKSENVLITLIILAVVAFGGVFWWRTRQKTTAIVNHPVGPSLPPTVQQPVGVTGPQTPPIKPKGGLSATDAVTLGATVGCTAYFGGVSAPACAAGVPLLVDGGKSAVKWIGGLF